MTSKGMVDAPFQLLINVVVFGMVMAIGFYLYTNATCWKCNELLKSQVTNLREAISTVGKGSTNTQESLTIKMEDLGGCADGIYIKHVIKGEGSVRGCSSFCPQHPNSCWVVIPRSSCTSESLPFECVDISGDTVIEAEEGLLGRVSDSADPWLQDSFAIYHNTMIKITNEGGNSIYISKL